jgi:HEAT repeat protein
VSLDHIGSWAAVIVGLGCFTIIVSLILVRLLEDRDEARRQRLRAPAWRTVLALSAGDEVEAREAALTLRSLRATSRRAIEEDVYALVPKLRGESRQRVRELLRAWGSTEEARRLSTSASPVRRARGYHRLGVLGFPDYREDLLAGLADRDHTARRTAMLALANYPAPDVVEEMLGAAASEPRLRHDFLAAVDQIGYPAVKALMVRLDQPVTEFGVRERILAAEGLGLLGDLAAVAPLEASLGAEDTELRIAALHALGQLGSPTSLSVVAEQLGDGDPEVRRAAATATGMLGGEASLLVLEVAMGDTNIEVARAAASALRRAGRRGLAILEMWPVPVAREALALEALRGRR